MSCVGGGGGRSTIPHLAQSLCPYLSHRAMVSCALKVAVVLSVPGTARKLLSGFRKHAVELLLN
jgi:hypothetical protein